MKVETYRGYTLNTVNAEKWFQQKCRLSPLKSIEKYRGANRRHDYAITLARARVIYLSFSIKQRIEI